MTHPPVVVGAGLKMYLGHRQTLDWLTQVARVAGGSPALVEGYVELFVLPSFPALVAAVHALSSTGVRVGAQDLFWEDSGPFTGEVSGAELAEIGCTYVEVGHAERRRLFGDSDEVVSAKTAAAFRNGLTPVLCLGESSEMTPEEAARECLRQMEASLVESRRSGVLGPMLVAYEPVWAIGAADAAGPSYIKVVCERLRDAINGEPAMTGSRLLYGGSAGAGLLPQLDGAADGLFLGRASHDPEVLQSVLDEAATFARGRSR